MKQASRVAWAGTVITFTTCTPSILKTAVQSIILLVFVVISFDNAIGQEKKEKKERKNVLLHPDLFYQKYFPHLKVHRKTPDSTYIKIYPNDLSIGVHILSPETPITIRPRTLSNRQYDPASKFRTNISDVAGFTVSYKLVTAGFAFLLNTGMNQHDDYARSHYRTATIKYNGAAYAFEFKYTRVQGFTDINQPGVLSVYRNRDDLTDREFRFEGIYNLSWRKYSYIGSLSFSQRQIKSRAGFLIKTGVYYNQLAGDSALMNKEQQKYFYGFQNVSVIRTISMRIAPGFGGNIVLWKRLYFSATGFASADPTFYKYLDDPDEKAGGRQSVVFVLDGKAGIGYQSRRFYAGLRYEAEKRTGAFHNMDLSASWRYTGFEIGYRFNAPGVVKKVYKETMPPGM